MIRVGIVGTGFGRRIHLPGFRRVAGCEVVGIAGQDADKTREIAVAEGVRAFSNWQELVDDPTIDAVSIATPPISHTEIALAALHAGKHVLCEKPMAMNLDEARQLVEAAKDAGVTAMVDFEFRAVPQFEKLKSELDAGRIGRVQTVEVSWLTPRRPRPIGWQNELASGGGVLFNFVSHVIDYIDWLFGPIASVSAKLSIRHPLSDGTRVADADDTCELTLALANGIRVNVMVSNVEPDGQGHRIDVVGERGSLRLLNPNPKDAVYGFQLLGIMDADDASTEDGRLGAFAKIAERFINAIPQRSSPSPSFQDGLRVQAVLDAARESDRLGRRVDVQSA